MSAIKLIRTSIFNMNQVEFAAAVGVTQGTVSRWERGMDPTLRQAAKIRRAATDRGLPWRDDLLFDTPGSPAAEAAE